MTGAEPAGPAWEPAFLAALAETGVVRRAIVAAGTSPRAAYRRRKKCPKFAAAWDMAVAGKFPARKRKSHEPVLRGPGWKKTFLEALAESSNVSASAASAHVPVAAAYKQRRTDPQFRAQWHDALLEGYDHLEMETLNRLRMGTAGTGLKFDIANALRLLALHKETVARERALREDEDEDAILASLDAKIEAMRAREEEAARLLIASEPRESDDA